MEKRSATPRGHLTNYDLACGSAINEAFGWFQGMDPVPGVAPVFAALTHRLTGGADDGSHNPFSVEGAGWAGYVGLSGERARFVSLSDGCRAAALVLQFREYQALQIAYRTRDAVRLAAALEVCTLRDTGVLAGLAAEVDDLIDSHGAIAGMWRSFSGRLGGWGRKRPTTQVAHQ